MTPTQKAPRRATREASKAFTEEERAAMRERAKEQKSGRRGAKADGESDVLAKIAEMPERDRAIAQRVHELVRSTAPDVSPRTWYGMPAYAKDGKIVCHFQSAGKFKTRYATLGFSDKANLDEGAMWPVAFALNEMTPDTEQKVIALLQRAVD